MELRTITVTRYVTPLREGGSLPAIVETDDGRSFVVKFLGACQGAKALVVSAQDRFVHCVLPANLRADNAALRALVGTRKLRFATREELLQLTGCEPGSVPPFCNLFGLPVFLDEALCANERVVFSAGSRARSITMRCADLVRVSGATVCRFAVADEAPA